MKTLNRFFMLMALMMGVITFTACSDDSSSDQPTPTPTEQEIADYTIIFYGTSGANIESGLLTNLQQVENATASKNVHFTGLMKWSKDYQERQPDVCAGVRKYDWVNDGSTVKATKLQAYVVDNAGKNTEEIAKTLEMTHITDSVYSTDAQYDMADPASLTKFINEAVAKNPAKHYMLIMWDHGSQFSHNDASYAPTSRALCQDNNIGSSHIMSIYAVQQGIDNSVLGGGKLDVLYADVCNLANIESMYQVRKSAKYFMGAADYTPGQGGDYTALIENLASGQELTYCLVNYVKARSLDWMNDITSPEEAMEDLSDANKAVFMAYYNALVQKGMSQEEALYGALTMLYAGSFRHDLSVFDLSSAEDFVGILKEVLDQFIELYSALDADGKDLVSRTIFSDGYFYNFMDYNTTQGVDYRSDVDILQVLSKLNAKVFHSLSMQNMLWFLKRATQSFALAQAENITIPMNLGYEDADDFCLFGMILVDKKEYEDVYYSGYSLKDAYKNCDFEIATNWSRFFDMFAYPNGFDRDNNPFKDDDEDNEDEVDDEQNDEE